MISVQPKPSPTLVFKFILSYQEPGWAYEQEWYKPHSLTVSLKNELYPKRSDVRPWPWGRWPWAWVSDGGNLGPPQNRLWKKIAVDKSVSLNNSLLSFSFILILWAYKKNIVRGFFSSIIKISPQIMLLKNSSFYRPQDVGCQITDQTWHPRPCRLTLITLVFGF